MRSVKTLPTYVSRLSITALLAQITYALMGYICWSPGKEYLWKTLMGINSINLFINFYMEWFFEQFMFDASQASFKVCHQIIAHTAMESLGLLLPLTIFSLSVGAWFWLLSINCDQPMETETIMQLQENSDFGFTSHLNLFSTTFLGIDWVCK